MTANVASSGGRRHSATPVTPHPYDIEREIDLQQVVVTGFSNNPTGSVVAGEHYRVSLRVHGFWAKIVGPGETRP